MCVLPGDTRARGIRNNNPGNLEANGVKWDGVTGDDGRFYTFESPYYGIRALSKLLRNYERLYGINTVSGILTRYAPSHENNTQAYINHVAKVMQVEPWEPINTADENRMAALVKAIIRHENGGMPYSDKEIAEGVSGGLA